MPTPSRLNLQHRRSVAARRWLTAWALVTGCATAWAGQVDAELATLPLTSLLDMPVTGASRFVQRSSLAPSAVTVVTREDILAHGHRTLSDVLRGMRGVVISGDRTYDHIGVRGVLSTGDLNTRVLLLVDGNRLNDPLFDQAYIGTRAKDQPSMAATP
jgi:outer membrane receptor for ferrienterochelin and colicin